MTRAASVLILLVASRFAAGSDPWTWHDLRVKVESSAEPILVNGLPLAVRRVTGSDVRLLAKRLEDKWREESGVRGVRSATHGNWMILSRLHDAGLEVVQWRDSGGGAELLWSRGDLPARIQLPGRTGLRFPPGCVPGRIVSGRIDSRKYVQQAARCKGSPRNMLSAVKASADRQGYEVLSRAGQLLARNGTSEVTVLAIGSADAPAGGTSLVYLKLDQPELEH
jgi:hypothetical protein